MVVKRRVSCKTPDMLILSWNNTYFYVKNIVGKEVMNIELVSGVKAR